MFWALAIVCDEYFVASLEIICQTLRLSDGVAGATFMAAGSSAPELFTSIMGVFAVKNDVGVGTIVGSAVFNLCCIIGGTAVLSPATLDLDWRPLTRDSMCYAVAIVALFASISDGRVDRGEAIVCVVLYTLYVLLMVFNEALMDWMLTLWMAGAPDDGGRHLNLDSATPSEFERRGPRPAVVDLESPWAHGIKGTQRLKRLSRTRQSSGSGSGVVQACASAAAVVYGSPGPCGTGGPGGPGAYGDSRTASSPNLGHLTRPGTEQDETEDRRPNSEPGGEAEVQRVGWESRAAYYDQLQRRSTRGSVATVPIPEHDDEGLSDIVEPEPGLLATALREPLMLLFEATVPDCNVARRFYLWTFCAACLWIGVLSYFMVTWATKLGCILHIHPAVMGVTVLAAGTSVPDAISSLIVAAKGQGDMAVSNAIGSNVFDILLGLGLPWTIATVFMGESISVDASNLGPMAAILLGTLMIIFALTAWSNFRLTKSLGTVFVSLYFAFSGYVIANELGAFGG